MRNHYNGIVQKEHHLVEIYFPNISLRQLQNKKSLLRLNTDVVLQQWDQNFMTNNNT